MSKMIEVNTCDLIGPALDWAVGVIANGEKPVTCVGRLPRWKFKWLESSVWPDLEMELGDIDRWSPSTDWSQCGPLIEKYKAGFSFVAADSAEPSYPMAWSAWLDEDTTEFFGVSPLIAACRAIVAAKLGDVVSVPAELVQQPTEGSGDE